MKLRLTFAFSILLLLAVSVGADESESKKKPELILTKQYIIGMLGSRIGWQKTYIGISELNDVEYNFKREEMFQSMTRSFDNETFTTSSTLEVWCKMSGAPVRTVEIVKDAARTETVSIDYTDRQAIVTTTIDNGTPHVVTLKYGQKDVLDSDEVFRSLKSSGVWKDGLKHSFFTVDADSASIVKESWHVVGKRTQKLLDGSTVTGTKVNIVSNGQASFEILDAKGVTLYFDGSIGITLELTGSIPDPFKPEPVLIETTMRSNVAVMSPQDLTELELTFDWKHDDEGDIPQIVDANVYHEVARLEDGFALKLKDQKLGKTFKLAYPLAEIPDDVKAFLEPTPQCQSDDKVLASKAKELVKGKQDCLKVAKRLVRFVRSRLTGKSGLSGGASAKQAYDERTGDCTEHSVLFVALARAAGLPARNVGGIVFIYNGNNQCGEFGYHAWSEVWLGKWVPVDATVGEVGTSARYIMFRVIEPRLIYGAGRTARCLRQRIRPKVVGYKKTNGVKWRKKGTPVFEYESCED